MYALYIVNAYQIEQLRSKYGKQMMHKHDKTQM